ncbi:MAG: helix-turn-helix domain-containing protein [Sciscionella sp.]
MPRKSPGARAKALGAELRKCRDNLNLSLAKAAKVVGMTKTVLYRLENGERNISVEDAARILGAYRVTGRDYDRLMSRARAIDEPGWWEHGLEGLPLESGTLADYESRANKITDFAPLLIPGLLQIVDYSRAAMNLFDINNAAVDVRITARLRRQQTLQNTGLTYTALIGEAALRTVVGGPGVHAAQLRALLAVNQRQNVTLKVVPIDAPAHPGQLGAFIALEFPEDDPVVHIEMATSGAFLDEEEQYGPYLASLPRIDAVAMGETESLRLISGIVAELEARDSDGRDTLAEE